MAGKVLRLAAGAGMIDGISTLLFRFFPAFCRAFFYPFCFHSPKKEPKKNGSLSYRLCTGM
jgi:hypothetical protein